MHIYKLSRTDKELQSEAYLDAPLSAHGEEQATNIKQKILALNAEIAITSPYRRTIDRLQPRDKAAMLVVKTIKNFFAEFA